MHALLLIAFKQEQRLEIYRAADDRYLLFRSYPFTAASGGPGPKLREGDGQIPEGFYRVEYLNPHSKFHLSFKLDYPNAFDRRQAKAEGRTEPGSDIFIHGGAQSTGCIAIGDEAITEVYRLVEITGKENVQVVIFPYFPGPGEALVPPPASPSWTAELYRQLDAFLHGMQQNCKS